MDSGSFSGGRLRSVWLQLAALWMLTACSVDNRPGHGVLLQVDTDLATPKDLDRVHVEVTQSGNTLLDQFFAIGSEDELPPLEISVGYRGDPAPAHFEVVGYRSGQVRVERFAITPIPSSRWAILRMRLQYLCVGQSAAAGGEGCDVGHTCVQGECKPASLAESDLPDYQMPGAVKTGSASSTGGVAGCFDVVSCFSNASEAQLESDCSFAINPEIGSEQLNVALRLARGGVGTCGDSGCYIPFDYDAEGYTFEPGRVSLPAVVCERMQTEATADGEAVLGVLFSNDCPAKRGGVAVCYESGDGNDDTTGASIVTGFLPDPSVGPACGGGRIKSCGMCGTQARGCDDGMWGEFGACAAEGECAVDEMRACGSDGVQTCGGDCRWGECLGQVCRGVASQACDRCGTQARACDNGVWAEWGACREQGACTPGETQGCGSQGTQACGGNCAWGPCGEQVCPGAPSEACGMCGSRARTCDASTGQWSEFAACSGEGACLPNQTRTCGRDGTQVCGGNCQWGSACTDQTCEGERSMACGNCGTRTRTCDMNSGNWSDWSACSGEGACGPDQTRGCGRDGTQTCDGSCRWDDACTGQSCLGANRQSCGNCGEQVRSCDGATGQWSGWSSCTDEGECRANSVRSCGTSGTQECGADCRWETSCTGQSCTGETSRPCENCGVQRRTCDQGSGRLSEWGLCENQGTCAPDATRSCGSQGTQTCGDNCQWGSSCTGQVCAEPAARACGNCGMQTSTCDPNTGRANWSTCTGEGQCEPRSTQECGSSGEQVCGANCRWSTTCSMQMCAAPRPSPQTCGLCGTRTAMCNSDTGEWTFPMQCSNERSCMQGQTRRCGTGNAGEETCGENCEWGVCRYECSEPLMRSCGFCGTGVQLGTCDPATGRVSYEETCRGGGACMQGTTQACRTSQGVGERVCTAQCAWPEGCTLTSFECTEPEDAPCGNCGRTGACDMTTGQRACNQPEDACEIGSSMVCSGEAGSGTRLCGPGCVFGACLLACRQAEDVACGNCGRTGACNMMTGERECRQSTGACEVGTSQGCTTAGGARGTQSCGASCSWGACQATCTAPEDAPCGNCGTTGACNPTTGERECRQPTGACAVGTSQGCTTEGGSRGTQSCGSECSWGSCQATCAQAENVPCGNCGRTGACNAQTGERECRQAPDACVADSTRRCTVEAGSGTQTCDRECVWSACEVTQPVCTEPENAPCGNCGRTGACNPTGMRTCVQPSGACERGTTRDCSTPDGNGTEACGAECTWGACQVTVRVCTEPEGVACGTCGVTGRCDPLTGRRDCTEPTGACRLGDSQGCETNTGAAGTQTCGERCAWSRCEATCRGSEGEPCGEFCGRTGACDASGERACVARAGACRAGEIDNFCSAPIGDGGTTPGSRLCGSDCTWSVCEPHVLN